jgi:CubicO group peptidase (beta-lactamase class C family)
MRDYRITSSRLCLRIARVAAVTLLLAALLLASGCDLLRPYYRFARQKPEQLADGWEVSSLAAEAIHAAAIAQLEAQIEDGAYGYVHSCLVVKNGKLVYEKYFSGQRRDLLHRLYSVTKSFTSALVGIALEQGHIGSVQETAVSYFPEYVDRDWDERKNAITLQNLLTMASGLQYDEGSYPYGDSRNSYTQMTSAKDWMEWTLDQPLVAEPGSRFAYSSGNTHLFAGILFKTTGLHADEFAEEYLFAPLGIDQYFWYAGDAFPTVSGAHGGLKLRPRDMAKFGYMYLNGGRWKGVQVVPEEWVAESFAPRIQSWGDWQYGYQWWIRTDRISGQEVSSFAARGYGDQYITLVPSLDMVVVITGGNEGLSYPVESVVRTIVQAALSGGRTSRAVQGAGWIALVPIGREDTGLQRVGPLG